MLRLNPADPSQTPADNAGMMPQLCSETWMESNCKGPRLGIFGGAGLAQAPPPAAADWSLGGEVNRSFAVNQTGQLVQYGLLVVSKMGGITSESHFCQKAGA